MIYRRHNRGRLVTVRAAHVKSPRNGLGRGELSEVAGCQCDRPKETEWGNADMQAVTSSRGWIWSGWLSVWQAKGKRVRRLRCASSGVIKEMVWNYCLSMWQNLGFIMRRLRCASSGFIKRMIWSLEWLAVSMTDPRKQSEETQIGVVKGLIWSGWLSLWQTQGNRMRRLRCASSAVIRRMVWSDCQSIRQVEEIGFIKFASTKPLNKLR